MFTLAGSKFKAGLIFITPLFNSKALLTPCISSLITGADWLRGGQNNNSQHATRHLPNPICVGGHNFNGFLVNREGIFHVVDKKGATFLLQDILSRISHS